MEEKFSFGEIVLIDFGFTDGIGSKKRPALILSEFDSEGDIILARVTSQPQSSEFDLNIENWTTIGLLKPSVIKINKLLTVNTSNISKKLGKLKSDYENRLKQFILGHISLQIS